MESDAAEPLVSPASEWWTARRFSFVLAILLVGAFPGVMLGLRSFVYRDYGVLAYPVISYAHESFWRGELPLWNPLSNCGAPFLAQWGTMTLYPLSLFYLVLPLPWSLGVFCLGHLFLGGLGMYFLARRWTGGALAASFAGAAFVFNGVTLSCLMWPNYTVALGWMPWVVWLVERAWREGRRTAVLAALAGAMQLLAGVPEIAIFTWVFLLLLWVGWSVRGRNQTEELGVAVTGSWSEPSARTSILSSGVILLGVVVMVAGLTAVQLLPFFDLLEHSQRDRSFATSKWALPGWGWANLLVPLFHCFETYQGPFVQRGQAFFSSCYLGAGLLGLALLGAWRVRGWRTWILVGATAFGLISAMGDEGQLYGWLRRLLPLVGVGRYPVKFMILPAFALPLLGAFALDWWRQRSPSDARDESKSIYGIGILLFGITGVLLWFAFNYPFDLDQWPATWHNALWRMLSMAAILGAVLALPRPQQTRTRVALELAILALLALDSTRHTPRYNPTINAAEFDRGLWQRARTTPPARLGESRVMISPEAEKLLLFSTERDLARDYTAKRLALWSHLNLLDDIPKVNGSSTLQLREEQQVESLIYGGTNQGPTGLLDFLAVSQRTAPANALAWSNRANFCPIVTAGQQPIFASREETLRALAAPEFDPRAIVYLPEETKASVTGSRAVAAKILRSTFSAHRVQVEVEAAAPAFVVIAQSFYHPWRATIDGRPVPVFRANHAFQAVEVPAGHSRLALRYEDRALRLGAVISALSALICLGMWQRGNFWPQPGYGASLR